MGKRCALPSSNSRPILTRPREDLRSFPKAFPSIAKLGCATWRMIYVHNFGEQHKQLFKEAWHGQHLSYRYSSCQAGHISAVAGKLQKSTGPQQKIFIVQVKKICLYQYWIVSIDYKEPDFLYIMNTILLKTSFYFILNKISKLNWNGDAGTIGLYQKFVFFNSVHHCKNSWCITKHLIKLYLGKVVEVTQINRIDSLRCNIPALSLHMKI